MLDMVFLEFGSNEKNIPCPKTQKFNGLIDIQNIEIYSWHMKLFVLISSWKIMSVKFGYEDMNISSQNCYIKIQIQTISHCYVWRRQDFKPN